MLVKSTAKTSLPAASWCSHQMLHKSNTMSRFRQHVNADDCRRGVIFQTTASRVLVVNFTVRPSDFCFLFCGRFHTVWQKPAGKAHLHQRSVRSCRACKAFYHLLLNQKMDTYSLKQVLLSPEYCTSSKAAPLHSKDITGSKTVPKPFITSIDCRMQSKSSAITNEIFHMFMPERL